VESKSPPFAKGAKDGAPGPLSLMKKYCSLN
jgi:hypothetical protein